MQRPESPLTPLAVARLHRLLLILLLAVFGYALAVPIWDADFWWHLASGRWIWQAGALPQSDPFGVFGDTNPIRSETVLKGQWLGQLLFYGLYQLGEAHAIVTLRVTLLLASLLLLHQRLRLAGIGRAGALAAVALVGLCLQGYTGDRPQLWSILFAALTFWLIDLAEQRQAPRLYWLLPLIALLWANVHGGVMLGGVLLVLHAVMFWWSARHAASESRRMARHLVAATVLFGGATLLSPNGLDAYAYIFNLQGSELQARTSEYVSALKIYQLGHLQLQLWVAIALLLALLGLAGLLRRAPGKAVLIGLLLALSIESFRYLVFLLLVASPYAAQGLQQLAGRLPFRPLSTGAGLAAAGGMLIASLALLLATSGGTPRSGVETQRYPVHLEHIVAPLHGRVFNFMNWGGYLLWHAPSLTPYIDGRMLDEKQLIPYTHMLWASPQGKLWFEQADFDWVLLPYLDQYGEIYGLNPYLQRHPRWQAYARDGNSILYARIRTGFNAGN